MQNFKATVQYDGSHYYGFQTQKKSDLPTVQTTIEEALSQLFKQETKIIGAGRTDSGVHAQGQVFNFYANTTIPLERMVRAINRQLPDDIIVTQVEAVDDAFHARKGALGKHYQYRVYNASLNLPFGHQYYHWIPYALDEEVIRAAAHMLEGKHNFKAFCASGSSVTNFERTVYYIRVTRQDNWWQFDFYGDGFLYNMIRIIVGTLLEIGSGRRDLTSLQQALETGQRSFAGKTAPAGGLYLKSVYYP